MPKSLFEDKTGIPSLLPVGENEKIHIEEKTINGTSLKIKRGEDTYFTRKATGNGFKLRISTVYDIGHLREFCIDRHFFLTFAIFSKLKDWGMAVNLLGKLSDKEWVDREIRATNL